MLLPAADIRPSPAHSKRAGRAASLQFKAERRLIAILARTGAIAILFLMICLLGYRAARHLFLAALARPPG